MFGSRSVSDLGIFASTSPWDSSLKFWKMNALNQSFRALQIWIFRLGRLQLHIAGCSIYFKSMILFEEMHFASADVIVCDPRLSSPLCGLAACWALDMQFVNPATAFLSAFYWLVRAPGAHQWHAGYASVFYSPLSVEIPIPPFTPLSSSTSGVSLPLCLLYPAWCSFSSLHHSSGLVIARKCGFCSVAQQDNGL
jgi:hypothetical protein